MATTPAVHQPSAAQQAAGLADAPAAADLSTEAPVVGRVMDTFRRRLPAHEPLRLPEVSADAGELGPLWLAAASLAGLGHLHHARSGQDSYSFMLSDDGAFVVVADGFGSRPQTVHLGSTLAARLLATEFARCPSKGLLDGETGRAESAIRSASVRLVGVCSRLRSGLSDRDLATTIAACIVSTDRADHRRTIVAVGDCVAFVLSEAGFAPEFGRDEGALNRVTAALPAGGGPRAPLPIAVRTTDAEGAVVLATDGLAGDIYDSPATRSWLVDRWSQPCRVMRFLDPLRYRRHGSHDDRTALVVWTPQPQPGGMPRRQPSPLARGRRMLAQPLAGLAAGVSRAWSDRLSPRSWGRRR